MEFGPKMWNFMFSLNNLILNVLFHDLVCFRFVSFFFTALRGAVFSFVSFLFCYVSLQFALFPLEFVLRKSLFTYLFWHKHLF